MRIKISTGIKSCGYYKGYLMQRIIESSLKNSLFKLCAKFVAFRFISLANTF